MLVWETVVDLWFVRDQTTSTLFTVRNFISNIKFINNISNYKLSRLNIDLPF